MREREGGDKGEKEKTELKRKGKALLSEKEKIQDASEREG